TCILDILRHLPRSLFSDVQLQVILWGLTVLGVDHIPSIRNLKDLDSALQTKYGVPSLCYQGSLGHVYYVNHLPSIITQEMGNPCVRPHIHHYPEDMGGRLDQPWQAARWLHEIDPSLATPMLRKGRQDFYVFEPTKLIDGTIVIPERWYTKISRRESDPEFWARVLRCAHMFPFCRHSTYPRTHGYVVHAYDTVEVPASDLLLSFPHLLQTRQTDGLPDPRNIIGAYILGAGVSPWSFTDPTVGNRWCTQSRGHRVITYMMWLYCDDTSGNMSKKWNKHNSFLFTAAGLPRAMVHQESNIHFLATSNIAPPLEMLDGIVDQLSNAQTHGIWAWDVQASEMILVIPAVLAMLGDNPMQSELACHVGLQGKFFCRNCWVKGADSGPNQVGREAVADHNDTHSLGNRSNVTESENGSAQEEVALHTKKGRRTETMQDLVDRARRFLVMNPPRTREEMMAKLHTMFQDVSSGMGKTRYAKMKMETGIKDTFMDVFVDRILKHVKGIRAGTDKYFEAVNAVTQGRDAHAFMSPVWRIKDRYSLTSGLDPHQDTPVEVLHVILLGFVKYFWRDVISRLNDLQKAELQVRLSSFDVSALGIPPLAGRTLVQYSGSLTGRDFRAISQAALFVLYDLVPVECYQTFIALSMLVPLVWQPCIEDLEVHLATLQVAIDHFLNCTVRWTPRWFNKPKFHIIWHLPDHIRRFGPAILFATEGFESYNAVIRDHSIHSNRQAPSRDIARGMARCNRIRHFLSGGKFMTHSSLATCLPYSDNACDWLVAGSGVQSLINVDVPSIQNVIADFFRFIDTSITGSCLHDKSRPKPLERTSTALHVPHALPHATRRLYQNCSSVAASNGEMCNLDSFVLAEEPRSVDGALPIIGRLCEILQIFTGASDVYQLPRIQPSGWAVLPATGLLCGVNVQHNCAAHKCTGSSTAPVYEEREKTSKTQQRIEHVSPSDLVLNTTQMHDAIHVQCFCIPPPPLERDWAIHTGTAAELEAQKIKSQKTSKGNTRSRGVPTTVIPSLPGQPSSMFTVPARFISSTSAVSVPPSQPSNASAAPAHFINIFHHTGQDTAGR
ncbi:hypothetical protein BKA82DRAFT_4410080, partial [Pisolithus tinctorius]